MTTSLTNPTANTNYLLNGRILVGWYPCQDSAQPDADELFTCNNTSSIINTNRNIYVNLTTKTEKSILYKYIDQVVNSTLNPMFIHYEIEDHNIPTDLESFKRFINLLFNLYQAPSHKFYIHCAGGHGRTGVVCGCLLKHMEYTTEEALDMVKAWHGTRDNMPSYPSPENELQRQFIRDYKCE